jgi:hypothetical protein
MPVSAVMLRVQKELGQVFFRLERATNQSAAQAAGDAEADHALEPN